MKGYWTCRRQRAGVKCRAQNPNRKRKCGTCGGERPPRRQAAHMVALETDYEAFIALNGGEHCAICGRKRGSRRLDRDHDHATGNPRGLLCARCNRALPSWITPGWLRTAADYLAKDRSARSNSGPRRAET